MPFSKDRQSTVFKFILLVFGIACAVIFGIALIIDADGEYGVAYTLIMLCGVITAATSIIGIVYNRNANIILSENSLEAIYRINRIIEIRYSDIKAIGCEGNALILKTDKNNFKFGPLKNSAEAASLLRRRVFFSANKKTKSERVLVGSVRSCAQLKLNIAKRFYHVPAYQIPASLLPIKYVSIYESSVTGIGGVGWYAEVISASAVKRKFIPCPMTRNNPEEYYYIFKTKEWRRLPETIKYVDESVYEARFTTSDALFNSKTTFELLGLRGDAETELYQNIRYLISSSVEYDGKKDEIDCGHYKLSVYKDEISVLVQSGEKVCGIFKSAFEKHPKKELCKAFESLYRKN